MYRGKVGNKRNKTEDEWKHHDANFHKVAGNEIITWTYKMPDILAVYTPLASDCVQHLEQHVTSNLEFDSKQDTLMLLMPNRQKPVLFKDEYCIKEGSCVIVMPKGYLTVTLEIKQLCAEIKMELKTDITVRELKKALQQMKGCPIDRIELLYKDAPLLNERYLYEYRIVRKSRIFVMLHLLYDLFIHVESFWGQTYHFHIDPCMKTVNIVQIVLKRISSQDLHHDNIYELYGQPLALYYGKVNLKFSECIGMYNITTGSILKLVPIGTYNKLNIQKIPVIIGGKTEIVRVSSHDRWSVIALRMHGLTGLPVNVIRLMINRKEIDITENIGNSWGSNCGASKIVSVLCVHNFGLITGYDYTLHIDLGSGVQEAIRFPGHKTIKQVKKRLEEIGVPNATAYKVYLQDNEIPNGTKIKNVISDHFVPLKLKLKSYPVFIHTPKAVIYKMFVHAGESWATFKLKIQLKTGLSLKYYSLMMSGKIISDDDDKTVFDSRIGIRMSLFLVLNEKFRTFFVIHNDLLVKFDIPFNPLYRQIREVTVNEFKNSNSFIYSVNTFLLWFFQKRRDLGLTSSKEIIEMLDLKGPIETLRLGNYRQHQVKEMRHEKRKTIGV